MSIKPVSFNQFDRIEFSLKTITKEASFCPHYKPFLDPLIGKQILVISNLKEGLLPLIFQGPSGFSYLTTGKITIQEGKGLSIGSSGKKNQLSLDELPGIDLRVGQVVARHLRAPSINDSHEVSFNLKVNVGTSNLKETFLFDTSPSFDPYAKRVACIINLRRECVADISTHPLCFKSAQGENIPLEVSGSSEIGARMVTSSSLSYQLPSKL